MSEELTERTEVAPKIYTGLKEQHGVEWIEKGWEVQASSDFPEELRELHIDDKLTDLIKEKLVRGEKDITVLDIGSGSDGVLINAFQSKEEFPKLHSLLETTTGVTVRVVGLTAARPGSEQGAELSRRDTEINSSGDEKSRIISENFGYTITKAHTLKDFLDTKEIDSVDLGFSTFGIGYLTPNNFDQCMDDIADKLSPGGQFYGITWDAVPAGARRETMGLIFMYTDMKPGHPLKPVFERMGNEEFKKFYEQSYEDQVKSHLQSIDFALSRGFISLEQAKQLLSKNPLPIPAFVRRFDKYTTTDQQELVRKHVQKVARKHPWAAKISWSEEDDIFDSIRHAHTYKAPEDDEKEKAKKPLINLKWLKRNKSDFYNEEKKVEKDIWDFIEKKFATPMHEKAVNAKKEFDEKTAGLSWAETKELVMKQDPVVVANFWDWYGMARDFEKLFTDRQAAKTSEHKQQTIDKLAQREDLEVHSSRIPGSHGLNVFVSKKLS